jgi:hypothetical protein
VKIVKVKYKKAGRDVQVMPNRVNSQMAGNQVKEYKINDSMAGKQVKNIQAGIKHNPFKGKKKTLF